MHTTIFVVVLPKPLFKSKPFFRGEPNAICIYFYRIVLLGALLRSLSFLFIKNMTISNRNTDSQFDWCLCNGIANSLNNCIFFKPSDPKKSYYDWFSWCFNDFFNISIRINHMFQIINNL